MNKQEREQILKLTQGLGELKGKVDEMNQNIKTNFTSLESRMIGMHSSIKTVIRDQSNRINRVEEDCAQMKGRSAGIAFAVSVIVSILGLIIAFWKLFPR